MEIISQAEYSAQEKASQLFSKAVELVYEDAKEKAPMLKNPKYGWFNKTNAAIYLGVSYPVLTKWIEKYEIPYSSIDGIKRFGKEDLDKFMKEHKKGSI